MKLLISGPLAGQHGGEVVFQGSHEQLVKSPKSLTTKYLTGIEEIPVPDRRRKWTNSVQIVGARENNLKNISVKFPLNTLTVITGVSGSGKSSLISKILTPALTKILGGYGEKRGTTMLFWVIIK